VGVGGPEQGVDDAQESGVADDGVQVTRARLSKDDGNVLCTLHRQIECFFSSVVDPDPDTDPVGSETFSRIRIREKSFQIRNRAAPDRK
jgi:hypothetical protein